MIICLDIRYPGVQIDVLASARGKQTYEMNKNVRWADVYDPDDDWPDPAEYTDMLGLLKVSISIFSFSYEDRALWYSEKLKLLVPSVVLALVFFVEETLSSSIGP